LTLECIRRHYLGLPSPIHGTLDRYKDFFSLFGNFKPYVQFFLLDDLINDNQEIKFYLPFDDFQTPPTFTSIDDYPLYKGRVIDFIVNRNERIKEYFKSFNNR
jgi:hypothetical protein